VTPCRSRFHLPTPESVYRNPIDPFGTTGSPVASSRTTVFHSAASERSTVALASRSAWVRNFAGTTAPSSPYRRSVTRNGRSVYVRM
jgi:hypothetical protein